MKKITALLLVFVLAIGMMTVANAAAPKITGIDTKNNVIPEVFSKTQNANPGDSFEIELPFSYFNVDGKTFADFHATLTGSSAQKKAALLKLAKTAEVRTRQVSGGKVIDKIKVDSATFDEDDAKCFFTLKVETVDPYVSVDTVDFEIALFFMLDGKRTDNIFIFSVDGEFGNEVTEVYADSDFADAWDGQVIEAEEYVASIEIIGNYDEDVHAHVRMAKGKKIYFNVTNDGDIKDEPIFDKYPSIEYAYTVRQVGLNSYTGNFIELGAVEDSYYVYGKNADGSLKYLGRGGELLPLSAKYYVSTMKLDLDESIDEEVVSEDEVPSIDGDYNPSTGI